MSPESRVLHQFTELSGRTKGILARGKALVGRLSGSMFSPVHRSDRAKDSSDLQRVGEDAARLIGLSPQGQIIAAHFFRHELLPSAEIDVRRRGSSTKPPSLFQPSFYTSSERLALANAKDLPERWLEIMKGIGVDLAKVLGKEGKIDEGEIKKIRERVLATSEQYNI